MKNVITIVTPVYNDWDSLAHLISNVHETLNGTMSTINFIVVNDGSSELPPDSMSIPDNIRLKRLDLITNVGHQRAILIGLCYCIENIDDSVYTIVMDSDGEDNPKDIKKLLNKCETSETDKVIFAKRSKRSEAWLFKAFYRFYKIIFRILTGESLFFGNYSCIPQSILPRIGNEPNFWNHYCSSIIKSNIPYDSEPTERGKRYSGTSKMNMNSLILHGLSSLSVYIESIIIRILKFSILIFILLVVCLFIIVYLKYFTELTIPGWTSFIFSSIFNILVTVLLFNSLIILTHLNSRKQPIARPISFYKDLIK